jgi:DNA-directed RNA polymerase II subunit RPB2
MDENDWNEIQWDIIDKFFGDNRYCLIDHHLKSYNKFYEKDIFNIFREKNPVKIQKEYNQKTGDYDLQCYMYMGGKTGKKIYYGKPVIFDEENTHFMYPNEARLRDMTYGFTIHYDIEIDFVIRTDGGESVISTMTLEKIFLGKMPIMMHSNMCLLNGMARQFCFNAGECKNDRGGYFIIDGKEKTIVCQEQFANNMINYNNKGNEIYSHYADVRSVSEDASKPVRNLSVRIVRQDTIYTNKQIVINVPNVRKPVPLFILMRALGVISDKAIIETCLLDLNENSDYVDVFIPSIHDANRFFTQKAAIEYIATLTKGKTTSHVLEILMDYLFPHIGTENFIDKAYYLGHIVFNLLKIYNGKKPTDRDNFKYKRVELTGTLIYNLFNEYLKLQNDTIAKSLDKTYYYNVQIYSTNFKLLIENNFKEVFKERILENGFKKAFKGNWGATENTKRLGIIQDLNRLSYNSALSHMRKLNLSIDSSAKVVAPRLLNGSQWGLIDPVDTPDGGNIGFHKHMAIMTHITTGYSKEPLIALLHSEFNVKNLRTLKTKQLSRMIKILVNGHWIGSIDDPILFTESFKNYRRISLIPIETSIAWNIQESIIFINTDGGRLCRPIFYIDGERKPSYDNYADALTWNDLITGSNKKIDHYNINNFYSRQELYGDKKVETLIGKSALLDFVDSEEAESILISVNRQENYLNNRFTHCEIHPSLMLGVMGNQVVYPENNQLPRDLFSCGQSKQAVSLYHSNYQNRIDKMGVVLNNGEIPLVKSRYMQYINNEEHPYGENVIVAIMCYSGYNVEDSILFNEGSVKRGLFRTTYFNMYQARESSTKVANSNVNNRFSPVVTEGAVGIKPGYDYSNLDEHGLIKENTLMDDKKVVIGKVEDDPSEPGLKVDDSVYPKKGQLGIVDKSFITEEEEGFRLAKVRIREERVPAIGDKFCSRCGQKGTVGQLIPERDMPFTKNGLKPDIIINPHALPSRMTIGQLIETIVGKAGLEYGAFGDCTAFNNKGSKIKEFGNLLTKAGYNSTGNEVMYNGYTGEQLNTEIFIGPTYYMRLKHMVKDKINYRARGPRTMMTRQTVQGRANDGGLRVGEMERDGLIAHGATSFLTESMMKRGDEYQVAICNKTGCIAIYNEPKQLFISPMSDGPIKFTGNVENKLNIVNVTKYGRDFSIVRIPYCFKLLMQELTAMGVHMRIITEDNIDQLENMSYSKTIDKLLQQEKVDYTKVALEHKQLFDESEKETLPVKDIEGDDEEVLDDKPSQDDESEETEMEEISIDKIESEMLPEVDPNQPPPAPTISEKPITSALTAANRAYEDNVSFDVRDRISSQVGEATMAVSDATNDFTRRASEGIQELLGVDTTPAVEEPQKIQQGGGIIPTMIPQMSPVTINVINGGSDSGQSPVNQGGGKKQSSQDGGIFKFKGGFSQQGGGSEEQYDGGGEQDGGDEEQEGGSSNSKVIKLV